jgi:hypothetical protein
LGFKKRDPSWQLSNREESSALLSLAALACFFSCRALYLGEARAEEWDSIRLLIAVMALVAIVAAPLMVVPVNIRRGVVSLLILLHFGGICTAVLAAEPAPWIIQQIWVRVYRPYLEFMYLNNAYHFYAPDPGPARYLWFRLLYEDENKNEVGYWLKVPEFDKNGRHQYALGLQYSRYMALTENTVATAPPPAFSKMIEEKGKNDMSARSMVYAEFVKRRIRFSPNFQPMVGEFVPPKGSLIIPFHPIVPLEQQYVAPSREVKQLVKSMAQHVTLISHPDHPEYKILGVKIYSIIHQIPPAWPFINGEHPADPEFYQPRFLGEFRFLPEFQFEPEELPAAAAAVGFSSSFLGKNVELPNPPLKLVPDDPFLYWLLPIGRMFVPPKNQGDEGSIEIRDYCRRHAGDPNWVQHLRIGEKWTPSIPWKMDNDR